MDGSRDLNISGFKVVNVADPTEPRDVVTKNYVDTLEYQMKDYINLRDQRIMKYINDLRNLTPNSSVEEYIRYINLRAITCHSLAGLVTMKSTLPSDPHPVYEHGGPHVWIESPTSSLEYKIVDTQAINNKYIKVSFQFPVIVETWTLYILDQAVEWKVAYVWEYSDDGENWTVLGAPKKIMSDSLLWCGNNSFMIFTNFKVKEHDKGHKYWRIVFQHSTTKSKYIYINYLQMRLRLPEETEYV